MCRLWYLGRISWKGCRLKTEEDLSRQRRANAGNNITRYGGQKIGFSLREPGLNVGPVT